MKNQNKFNRSYIMSVQIVAQPGVGPISPKNSLQINYPLTLEFDVRHSVLSNANFGKFRIYNLTAAHRKAIYHDVFDTEDRRHVTLNAGYSQSQITYNSSIQAQYAQKQLPLIFQGNIQSAYSMREGTNWVTTIEAYDGIFGMQNGQTNISLSPGTEAQRIIRSLVSTMAGVGIGAIGNIDDPDNLRGVCLNGNSWNNIVSLFPNNECFVHNEKAFVMAKTDFINYPGTTLILDSFTGILQTPRKWGFRVDVETLFEPNIALDQLVMLNSEESEYNGQYVVKGYHHRGIISGAVNGKCVTELNLLTLGSKFDSVDFENAPAGPAQAVAA